MMNENTWGRWCQKGWVIEDEWEYMRMLVSGRMGDWRWMRKHEDVGVRKDGWLKMNENTLGCWCREGWVIDDEWEYMRMLVSQRMSDWRWMRIREDVGVAKDEWLKMNENTWGRWCQKGWVIEDEWGYVRTLMSESGISCRHSQNIMWGFLSFFLWSPDDGYSPAVVTIEVDTHHPSGVWQWTEWHQTSLSYGQHVVNGVHRWRVDIS